MLNGKRKEIVSQHAESDSNKSESLIGGIRIEELN
jgi:hypothetical protein